jgi:hypothetical protein
LVKFNFIVSGGNAAGILRFYNFDYYLNNDNRSCNNFSSGHDDNSQWGDRTNRDRREPG